MIKTAQWIIEKTVSWRRVVVSWMAVIGRVRSASIMTKMVLGLVVVVLTGGSLWMGWGVVKPERVRVANLGSKSLSVTWLSQKPARGCAYLWSTSLKPTLTRRCHEGEKSQGHLVHFEKLAPETRYGTVVVHGLWHWSGVVWATTRPIAEQPPAAPQSAYGSVYLRDDSPAAWSLVYMYTQTNRPQYPVAVMTNAEGRYATSLTNLMLEGEAFVIEVWSSPLDFGRIETDIRHSTPFASVYVGRMP